MNKRISFLIASLLLSLAGMQTAMAQKMVVNLSDGKTVEFDVSRVNNVEFMEIDFVDLGLPSGTLWATRNVGASAPSQYGGYFAWGETQTKNTYSWETYQLSGGSSSTVTKYCSADGLTYLQPEDDAATANWGVEWQMPSLELCQELCNSNYTTTEWTQVNGVDGMKVTSLVNGKSIFLPAVGFRKDTDLKNVGLVGNYWTSSKSSSDLNAYELYISSSQTTMYMNNVASRSLGMAIRPVRVKDKVQHEYVDLGLPSGTLWATTNIGAEAPFFVGDYFFWGETTPRTTIYGYTFTDNPIELPAENDAATVLWGANWQTPSKAQMEELFNSGLHLSWVQQYGSEGILVENTKLNTSIFLPIMTDQAGYYLSRSIDTSDSNKAYVLTFLQGHTNFNIYSFDRSTTISPIRPVRKQ